MHDAFKARLKNDLGSLCAFMAAAVIDQLLPGTTVSRQLDAILDAAAADVASRDAPTGSAGGATFWDPEPVAIKDEAPSGVVRRTQMISTAMGADSEFLRLIELEPIVSADSIELGDAVPDGIKSMLRRASFDLTRSDQNSRGFVRSLD